MTNEPEKLERKRLQEQQRRIKPGECLKYIKVLLDPEAVSSDFRNPIIQKLNEMGITYEIKEMIVPRSWTWERCEFQTLTSEDELLALTDRSIIEPHVGFILFGEELIDGLNNKSLHDKIKFVKAAYPSYSITMVVYGLKHFCRQNGNLTKRGTIEKCLTELQVLYNCNSRLAEYPADLALIIGQFSKAIAEIPFKQQKANQFSDINMYLLNDNKDCVRVEGSVGLSRLWQQHLTRLPLVTLETAESIMSKYPKPRMLMEAYESSVDIGQDLLADLKVRRAGGPLATDRRIGTELSRKLFTLYTSNDPNEKL